MEYKECRVVAEACCNHQGNFKTAKQMIKVAASCGVDYVKFQKRNCHLAVPLHMQNKPHPCPMHSFGETYLAHRLTLEFSLEQHIELKKYCEEQGTRYSCSVWDEDSTREIISLDPDYIKVPSACNGRYDLLKILFSEYKKNVHISLGMSTRTERALLYEYLKPHKSRVVLYWTTSDYPVKFEDMFLLEIPGIKEQGFTVGLSGHHLGISVDVAGYTLGCEWVERHFTLDRTAKGTDNSASLERTGLEKLCRDLKAAYKALQYKDIKMTTAELANREKLRVE